jgi:two-component system OmpR family response regulator
MRVLLVEDDSLLGSAIKQALIDATYTIDWVTNGNTALSTIALHDYALVLLDLGLPEKDGIDVLRTLRQQKNTVPIIIITARDAVEDRIQGLDLGADDYLIKPFLIDELQARIRAILRRKYGLTTPLLYNQELELNPATREVSIQGVIQSLSAKEYALLHCLMLRPGTILSRQELEEHIYGWNEEVASNAVEFLIHGLRKKLGKNTIKNVRGLGWMVNK